jgi:hypothetical protein
LLRVAGRLIQAAYVPLPNYSALFPDSIRASQTIMSSAQALAGFNPATFMGMALPNLH